jgi:hypothetical protein
VPTIYQWVSCTWILKKSFDFLFFNFRQHAEGAQRPCHRKRPKMSQRPYLRAFCKARKFHFKISFTKNFINPNRLSSEAGSQQFSAFSLYQ